MRSPTYTAWPSLIRQANCSRLRLPRQQLLQPFDLRAAIEHSRQLLLPLAERKGLRLEVRVAPEVGQIVGDRRRVEQVLINLVGNGVKFTDKGQVTGLANVLPNGRPQSDDLFASLHGPVARIQIVDSGIGIRPEDVSKLFNAFRQLDSGLNRQHEGTGLGLVICKKLLDAMEGDRTKGFAAGCIGYIEKPINPETFLSEIRPFLPADWEPNIP